MRSLKLWLAFVLMAFILAGAAVVAQAPGQKDEFPKKGPGQLARISVDDMVERIMAFDKNKDGKVTRDELPERMHHLIALGDTNKDGALDRDEIKKLATTLAAGPGEPIGRGFGTGIRQEGGVRVGGGPAFAGPGPGFGVGGPGPGFPGPGPGLGDIAGVVDDLKLSGKKKDQALAAVKAHQEEVIKMMVKARADLLGKMKEILSEEELADLKAGLDRPRGATFFSVGPREAPKGGVEKKLEKSKK